MEIFKGLQPELVWSYFEEICKIPRPSKKEEKIAEEEIKKEAEKKDKKIFKIQIGLIVALVLIASLVYFFGYDLLEPFIKID